MTATPNVRKASRTPAGIPHLPRGYGSATPFHMNTPRMTRNHRNCDSGVQRRNGEVNNMFKSVCTAWSCIQFQRNKGFLGWLRGIIWEELEQGSEGFFFAPPSACESRQ